MSPSPVVYISPPSVLSPPPISIASRDPCARGFVGLARSLARLAGGFVACYPRWSWFRLDVVGRADVPRRALCNWQDSCSCYRMDSCRASCSLVEDLCPSQIMISSLEARVAQFWSALRGWGT
uniref:Uncharacterized protein n=1 Tax=Caenorhabditis japonica TaxID=281687 RepID=A0A8R1EA20_CAEJA